MAYMEAKKRMQKSMVKTFAEKEDITETYRMHFDGSLPSRTAEIELLPDIRKRFYKLNCFPTSSVQRRVP